jgi:hypothetical protein
MIQQAADLPQYFFDKTEIDKHAPFVKCRAPCPEPHTVIVPVEVFAFSVIMT